MPFIDTNGIRLHYQEYGSGGPVLVLSHGLTANCHAFDGLLRHGLADFSRVLTVDLRGRGLSDKPEAGYAMSDHMHDLLGLFDELDLENVVLGGHSFGGLLSIFTAYHHPERVQALLIIDAAARLHPRVRELVAPSMQRLGKQWPNMGVFLQQMKQAPHLNGYWDENVEAYFRADVRELPDGQVTTQSQPQHIQQAIDRVLGLGVKWLEYIEGAAQPAVLINGTENFGAEVPLLPEELALETVEMMRDARYAHVPGNHLNMLFGDGAIATVAEIRAFLGQSDLF